MINSYNISLIISGDDIRKEDFDFLKEYGKTKFCKKGEKVSSVIPSLKQDRFIFSYSLKNNEEKSLETFCQICQKINRDNYDYRIRIFIQSFEAQIEFILSNKMLKILSELDVDVEFSILSWGEVYE